MWLKKSADILDWSGRFGWVFFLSLFLCGAAFHFRQIRAMIKLTIGDLRVVVLAQLLRWLDTEDVEQSLGERSTFA